VRKFSRSGSATGCGCSQRLTTWDFLSDYAFLASGASFPTRLSIDDPGSDLTTGRVGGPLVESYEAVTT
jgi:hypothetical protein